ncbi:MAG: hypothetical protein Q8M40_10895 [Legionella sp.]|nr:hypothetical protein [Legionella sp.]
MSHKLQILKRYANEEEWFLRSNYPISYKLVIIYCFFEAIKQNRITNIDFRLILNNTYNYVKDLPPDSFECEFFSIYRFYDHENVAGVFCVDHTHTCFPLVFYHNHYKPHESRKLRVAALQKCVSDILNKCDDIFHILDKAFKWDKSIQESILRLIPERQRVKPRT